MWGVDDVVHSTSWLANWGLGQLKETSYPPRSTLSTNCTLKTGLSYIALSQSTEGTKWVTNEAECRSECWSPANLQLDDKCTGYTAIRHRVQRVMGALTTCSERTTTCPPNEARKDVGVRLLGLGTPYANT